MGSTRGESMGRRTVAMGLALAAVAWLILWRLPAPRGEGPAPPWPPTEPADLSVVLARWANASTPPACLDALDRAAREASETRDRPGRLPPHLDFVEALRRADRDCPPDVHPVLEHLRDRVAAGTGRRAVLVPALPGIEPTDPGG